MKLRNKIILHILPFLILLTIGLVSLNILSIVESQRKLTLNKVENADKEFNIGQKFQTEKADLVVKSIVNNIDIQKSFYEMDRISLLEKLEVVWDEIKNDGVVQMQFHLPPAKSFLRLHMPEKYNDDLSFLLLLYPI